MQRGKGGQEEVSSDRTVPGSKISFSEKAIGFNFYPIIGGFKCFGLPQLAWEFHATFRAFP